ncbi:MAG: hypothetical protein DRH37_06660, partial [Deltaproteobacteria bacterium]
RGGFSKSPATAGSGRLGVGTERDRLPVCECNRKEENMDAVKLNKLDEKLRELIEITRQTEVRRTQRKNQSGTGNVILRRKGKQDKRFSL